MAQELWFTMKNYSTVEKKYATVYKNFGTLPKAIELWFNMKKTLVLWKKKLWFYGLL